MEDIETENFIKAVNFLKSKDLIRQNKDLITVLEWDKSNLSSTLAGKKKFPANKILKFLDSYPFDNFGKSEFDPEKDFKNKLLKGNVALHSGLIEAGTNITVRDSPDYVEGFLQVDGIGPNDGSWIVSGHSMHPTISKGCRVVIRRLENLDVIVWNEVYVVDLKEHGAKVKRIKPGKKKNTYILVSDNKEYDPFEVSLERDVLGIYRVLMVFEMY